MNILILNGSPKKRLSSSGFFSGVLKPMLMGNSITELSVRNPRGYVDILGRMKEADAIILSVPLYVDGIPSHVLRFLKEAEQFCEENPCPAKFYVISNAGFVEGRQNEIHLEQCRCWCGRAGVEWGGGLGIGGGVMLRVIFYVLLADIGRFLVGAVLNLSAGEPLLSGGLVSSLGKDILVWLFLSCGVLACTWLMARAINRGRSMKNLYTRVMVPSFLFLVISDIFMLIMALLKGTLIFSLFKKDPYTEYGKPKPQE